MKPKAKSEWASYERCFVITIGVCFFMLALWIGFSQWADSSDWPLRAWLILGVLATSGAAVLVLGIWGSTRSVQQVARGGSSHEASWLIMLLAAPLYFILNFHRPR